MLTQIQEKINKNLSKRKTFQFPSVFVQNIETNKTTNPFKKEKTSDFNLNKNYIFQISPSNTNLSHYHHQKTTIKQSKPNKKRASVIAHGNNFYEQFLENMREEDEEERPNNFITKQQHLNPSFHQTQQQLLDAISHTPGNNSSSNTINSSQNNSINIQHYQSKITRIKKINIAKSSNNW